MQSCDRPLATTTQFRAAVKHIITDTAWTGYTDKPKCCFKVDTGKRYVKLLTYSLHLSEKDIEAIEFVLWAQGVTANTRVSSLGVRGTCILVNFKKEKQNV